MYVKLKDVYDGKKFSSNSHQNVFSFYFSVRKKEEHCTWNASFFPLERNKQR